MKRELEPYQLIERSIIKKYRKELWTPFIVAVKRYELVQAGDRIAVCISGGKDSMLMAKLIQELQRHGKIHFEAVFLVMNPGYNADNWKIIQDNAELLGIPLTVFESDIFDVVSTIDSKSPCYLCARMRRGYLYNYAQEKGCNKISLGHHFDDVIETTLLSMFYGCEVKTMMPKLHSDNFSGIELIRPMYHIHEEDIISWKNYNELTFINCACRFTEGCSLINDGTSKRKEIKELIKNLRKINKDIDYNIFKSMSNLGYREGSEVHSFLDDYDNKK